jgi:hypothetical protein
VRRIRIVNACSAVACGVALSATFYGDLRLAIAGLCVATLMQLWSMESLRTLTNRETRR